MSWSTLRARSDPNATSPPRRSRSSRRMSIGPASVSHVELPNHARVAPSSWTGSCRASSSLMPPTRRRAPSSRRASARRSRFDGRCPGRRRCRGSAVKRRAPEHPSHQRSRTRRDAARASAGCGQDRTRGQAPGLLTRRCWLISSRKAITLSGESRRRPSAVIDTSSSVGGPASANNSSTLQRRTVSSDTITRVSLDDSRDLPPKAAAPASSRSGGGQHPHHRPVHDGVVERTRAALQPTRCSDLDVHPPNRPQVSG